MTAPSCYIAQAQVLVAPGPTTSGGAMNAIDRERTLARFWAKVNKTETCWLWTAGTVRSATLRYGSFHIGGRKVVAHRFAYEACVGPIPAGLTLDHVKARGCTSTLCVNPAHMEPVTLKVNVLRGSGTGALNAQKTHCNRGHPLSGENLRMELGGKARRCHACRRLRDARRRSLEHGRAA